MAATRTVPRTRRTADERREEILDAAVAEFAAGGYGTSTETIAARAGISQPYLFRLFGTKKQLFIASFSRCCETIRASFQAAAEALPADASTDEKLAAMGQAYLALIANPDLLRIQMQGFVAAAGDPEIGAAAREGFGKLFRYVETATGADEERVLAFFSHGMLLSVSAALGHGMKSKDTQSWAAALRAGK